MLTSVYVVLVKIFFFFERVVLVKMCCQTLKNIKSALFNTKFSFFVCSTNDSMTLVNMTQKTNQKACVKFKLQV